MNPEKAYELAKLIERHNAQAGIFSRILRTYLEQMPPAFEKDLLAFCKKHFEG